MEIDAYRRCQSLFAEFPLAARVTKTPWPERSMVLMVPDSARPRFFILSQEDTTGSPFSLFPWRAPGATLIPPGCDSLADEDAEALTLGVPIPPHGSLFGWVSGSAVTALICAYARYSPQTPTPSWAVMPCLDASRDGWPPFTCKKLLGRWFWEYVRSGNIRDLKSAVAMAPGTVFWVDTTELLGAGCCAVARDIAIADGLTLPKGRYLYYQAALSGTLVPPLRMLLRDPARADLASRSGAEGTNLESAECR